MKLNNDEVEYVKNLVEVNGNSKSIQHKTLIKHGKVISFKKISNIKYSNNSNTTNLNFLKSLATKPGVSVEILEDESDFKGLFCQDFEMKKCLEAYPEIIFIDATYKLLDCRALLYFLVVLDASKPSDIMSPGIVLEDTEKDVGWFVDTIKRKNPEIRKYTKIFV